jgi:hypothetical protein
VVASAVDIDPPVVFQINNSIDGIRVFIYPGRVFSQLLIPEQERQDTELRQWPRTVLKLEGWACKLVRSYLQNMKLHPNQSAKRDRNPTYPWLGWSCLAINSFPLGHWGRPIDLTFLTQFIGLLPDWWNAIGWWEENKQASQKTATFCGSLNPNSGSSGQYFFAQVFWWVFGRSFGVG